MQHSNALCTAMLTTVIIVMVATVSVGHSAKIVGFPVNSYSHVANFVRIGEELHLRGHSYTLLVSDWTKRKLTHRPTYDYLTYQSHLDNDFMNFCSKAVLTHKFIPPKNCSSAPLNECRSLADNSGVIDKLAQADILVCDASSPCCPVLAKIASVPLVIDFSPVALFDPIISNLHRVPNNLAYVPQLVASFTNRMTFMNRLTNTVIYVLVSLLFHFTFCLPNSSILHEHNITGRVFYDRSPAAMLLIGSDFAVEFPRPITPAVKMVGPILAKSPEPLPQELEDFLNSNDKGFVYVSFGSVATVVQEIYDVNSMAKGLARLPYIVLWKYKGPTLNVSNNIKLIDWVPQNDVIGHRNIKAFISHCGMNSLLEAAYHGVPVVAVPLFLDQINNAQKVVALKMGKVIEISSLNADTIEKATISVITNGTYKYNAKRVSSIIRDRPSGRSPVQEAGDWIEYALRFDGGKHLLSEEFNLAFYQIYLLDVLGFIMLLLLIVYYSIKIMCRRICKCCKSKAKQD